jgi:hypothetical protein
MVLIKIYECNNEVMDKRTQETLRNTQCSPNDAVVTKTGTTR